MGLYDDISIPVELLKASDDARIRKHASLLSGDTASFQTKDLDCVMQQYELKKVGDQYVLHKDIVESEVVKHKNSDSPFNFHFVEKSRTSSRQHVSDTIMAYDYFTSDAVDISIDLKIKLVDGVLMTLDCFTYEERDPTARIKMQNEAMQKLKDSIAYRKTLLGKLTLCVRNVLLCLHKNISTFNSRLLRCICKL